MSAGYFDVDGRTTIECPDCEGEGYRYNSPLASRKGPCVLCGTVGLIGVAADEIVGSTVRTVVEL